MDKWGLVVYICNTSAWEAGGSGLQGLQWPYEFEVSLGHWDLVSWGGERLSLGPHNGASPHEENALNLNPISNFGCLETQALCRVFCQLCIKFWK